MPDFYIVIDDQMFSEMNHVGKEIGVNLSQMIKEALSEWLKNHNPLSQQTRRETALSAIQSGKYAVKLKKGEMLPSEVYAEFKEREKRLEDRGWNN